MNLSKIKNLKNPRSVIAYILVLFFIINTSFDIIGVTTVSPRVNSLLLGFSLLIPVACYILVKANGTLKNKIVRMILLIISIISVPLFLFWLFIAFYITPEIIFNNIDPSYKLIKTVTIGSNYYRVYYVDEGILGDSVVVRKEKKILPGFYSWEVIDAKYPYKGAEIIEDKSNEVKIIYND